MNLRQIKSDVRLNAVAELDQLLADQYVIQASEFVFPNFDALRNARVLVEVVIRAEPGFVEQFIYGFTTGAAEIFFLCMDGRSLAVLATVIARSFVYDIDHIIVQGRSDLKDGG